jgi:transposase
VIEAISWKYRTGTPWRELPERFGPWQTAYERLTRWSADSTWAKLLARGQADADAAGELDWLVAADSTMVRVHQHGGQRAAGRRQRRHRARRRAGGVRGATATHGGLG